MSSLKKNDLAVCVNKRVVRNLAISMDHAYEKRVADAHDEIEALPVFIRLAVEALMAKGFDHPVELAAQAALIAPRALFATTNPAFVPSPGVDEVHRLVNHLKEFDEIAAGPTDSTLNPEDLPPEYRDDLPCPITFKKDPGRRFTFLRTEFLEDLYDGEPGDFVDVTPQGVVITIKGTAYQGDFFSRSLAEKHPTHNFTLKLRYAAEFVASDAGFGAIPFKMVKAPPAPSAPGLPSLPKKGQYIFAVVRDGLTGKLLPHPKPSPNPQKCVADPELCIQDVPKDTIFKGVEGDLLFEDETPVETPDGEFPVPRFRVERFGSDEPGRLVIREIGDATEAVLAEGTGGRIALRFVAIDTMELTATGNSPPLNQFDKQSIDSSLTKINPTMAQAIICALDQPDGEGLEAAVAALETLQLLGPRGLDLPLLPQTAAIPIDAHLVRDVNPDDLDDGFPLHSVRSSFLECSLAVAKYFDASQVFGVAGRIDNALQPEFDDFSDGADLSLGASQRFLQPMLDLTAQKALVKLKDLDGMNLGEDAGEAPITVTPSIQDGHLRIQIAGSGEYVTPSPLPNLGFDFDANIRIRVRAQKAIVVDNPEQAPKPVDRFGCPIPKLALDNRKLSLVSGWLELPNALNPNGTAEENPLGFLAYNDPKDGIACFTAEGEECSSPVRLAPPVLNEDGSEIVIDDPSTPPDACPDDSTVEYEADEEPPTPGGDHVEAFGQAAFALEENESLRAQWGILIVPPVDDDIEVTIDADEGTLFLLAFLGSLLAPAVIGAVALVPVVGPLAAPIVATGLLTGIFLLPFGGVIATIIVGMIAPSKLQDVYSQLELVGLDSGKIIGIFLREPQPGHPPYALEVGGFESDSQGALIIRNHVVVQAAEIIKSL